MPSYLVSLNSFLVAILILNCLSFKLGYKYGSASGCSDKVSLSINSFFNKNLLHSLEYKFSLLQLSFLYSLSRSSVEILRSSEDNESFASIGVDVEGTDDDDEGTDDDDEGTDDDEVTDDDVGTDELSDVLELSSLDNESVNGLNTSSNVFNILLDNELACFCEIDDLSLDTELSDDDSIIKSFFFSGFSVIILYIMNIIYILVILY